MGYPDSGCIQLHSATFLNNRSLIAIGFAALFMAAARCDLARFLCHPTIVGSTIPFGQNHFEFPCCRWFSVHGSKRLGRCFRSRNVPTGAGLGDVCCLCQGMTKRFWSRGVCSHKATDQESLSLLKSPDSQLNGSAFNADKSTFCKVNLLRLTFNGSIESF